MTRSVAVFGFLLFGYFGFVGCSSGCPGTVVNGTCQKTCQDSQCAAGDVCVGNACRPACTSSAQCGAGQTCTARVSDSGKRGTYCTGGGSSSGVISEKPCGASSDCDEKSGVRCVGGTCTFTCEVHDDCVTCSGPGQCISAGSCTGTVKDVEGNDVRVCQKDSFPRAPGQFGSHCPNGPGTPDCDAANDFTCIGTKGDIDAYCTKNFCGGDGDCPTGFFCATVQVTARPCDATCGFPSPTPGTCVASSDIGVGKHYQCGAVPHSLVTTQCLHRQFCAPCKADADCLAVRHQVCAKDASGEKICTVLCDDNINSCPWGTAASCHTTDDALGAPTCSHRFGSCHGTGKSCEPCVDQRDCPTGVCTREQFTDERFCIDYDASCSCPAGSTSCAGGGCPLTPAPALSTMVCVADQGHCIGAVTGSGCWP